MARNHPFHCLEKKIWWRKTTQLKIGSSKFPTPCLLCPLYWSFFWSCGNFSLLLLLLLHDNEVWILLFKGYPKWNIRFHWFSISVGWVQLHSIDVALVNYQVLACHSAIESVHIVFMIVSWISCSPMLIFLYSINVFIKFCLVICNDVTFMLYS